MGVTKIRQNQIESISAANADSAIEAGAISVSRLVAGAGEGAITDSELSYLKGLEGSVQQQLDKRLKEEKLKDSTQIADWSDDTVAVTAKAIADMVAKKIGDAQLSGVMVYSGAWSALKDADGNYDTSKLKAGATFCYDEGDAPYGHVLEAGDMIVAAVDSPQTSKRDDWNVVQTNISGAVTSITTSSLDGMLVVFSGKDGNKVTGSTLSGLVKLENGVVKEAAKEDLPEHDHPTEIRLDNKKIASFEDVLNLSADGILSITWDADKGALVFGVTPQVSNGVPEEGKYVAGISVNEEGKLVLVYKSFPDGGLKTGVALEGVQDGSNVVFLMPETCADTSETVILNGVILTRGADYTIAENRKITFAADSCIPKSDDILRVNYIKK